MLLGLTRAMFFMAGAAWTDEVAMGALVVFLFVGLVVGGIAATTMSIEDKNWTVRIGGRKDERQANGQNQFFSTVVGMLVLMATTDFFVQNQTIDAAE